jgi:hypothetical protein
VSAPGRPPSRGVPVLVFLAALSLYFLTASGSLTSTDAVVTFELTRSLVERHSIALSGNLLGLEANRGVDGRYYSQYGIGHALYNVPFFVAGTWAQRAIGRPVGKPDTLQKAAVALGSAVAAAGAVALVWLLAFRISGAAGAALFAAVAAAIASPLWPYSKFGFATPLTTLILLGAAYLSLGAAESRRVRGAAAAGGLLAFGWLTRHEMALALVPFAWFLVDAGRARGTARTAVAQQVIALVACTMTGGLLWAMYNVVRFGSPLDVGYHPTLGSVGYLAFLVAPGGSVLLYAPIAALCVVALFYRQMTRSLRILLAGPLVVFYAFYGALADWPGGRSYGPRYLVPMLVLMIPAIAPFVVAPARRWRPVAALVALCAVLQLPGVLVDYSKVSIAWSRTVTRTEIDERNWHLRSSMFVLNEQAAVKALPLNVSFLAGRLPLPDPPAAVGEDDRGFAQQFSFSLDFWWMYLIYLRVLSIPAALGVAAVLMLSTSVFSAAALRRARAG